MKKSLLGVAFAAFSSVTFAQQNVDASNWTKGEDISDKIGWGNLKFENNPMDYWTLTKGSGSTTETGGLFEVYDGSDCDLFQYVYLPKGQYRLQCQGYYRCGGSDQNESGDPTAFDNDDFEYNAQLYVQDGTYDVNTKEFKKGYLRFENPLMPRLYEMRGEQLFFATGDQPSWMTDGSYNVKGGVACGPCSVDGSLVWFGKGYYSPTWVSDEEAYNLVDFFVMSDGYVRLGVTKIPSRGQDSFMVTNFQMIYNGDVADNAEILAKRSAVGAAYAKLIDYSNSLEDDETIYGIFYDVLSETVEEAYVDATKMSVDECNAAIESLNKLYDEIVAARNSHIALRSLCNTAKLLVSRTDYPGKSDFESALAKAERLVDTNATRDEEGLDTFAKAYDELAQARMAYVMSEASEDGSYDFTFAVTYPFFCLPEYEPTWDNENQQWVPNEEVMASNWAKFDDCDGTDKTTHTVTENNEQVTYDVPAIAAGVTISNDTSVKNAWFSEGTEGGHLSIYWNDKLPCAKKWDLVHDGYNRTCQVVTGLPNGYYKLKALAQTWSNDWNDNCRNHIFIQSGDNKSMSEYLTPGGWWGNDINQWKELETQMIQVTNNEVLIAGEDNGFAAFTGFRLYYYGETPNFRVLLADQISSVEAGIEELWLKGDKANASALYAKVPAEIKTPEEYLAAMSALEETQAYIDEAKKVVEEFENIVDILMGEPNEAYLALCDEALKVSKRDVEGNDYKNELVVKEAYEALNAYFAVVNAIDAYTDETSISEILTANNDYFKANYCTAAQVRERQTELEYAYHKVFFAATDEIKNASEAKPVDVTAFVVNADFSKGTTGWNAPGLSVNENFKDAEFYDKTFNINQTVYGLPAGCYMVQVQGFYRDGNNYSNMYTNFVEGSLSDVELWENHNVVLYANERTTYMTSFASEYYTERGMVKRFEAWDDGNMVTKDITEFDDEAIKSHPWDASFEVTDYDEMGEEIKVTLYYPNSMEGAMWRFQQSPEAYINKVMVMVDEKGTLSFGLRKSVKIGADWCIFDNFKLFYLGTETPTGVSTVNVNAEAKEFFTLSGIKTNGMKKGINIVKMADGSVVKIVK
ncbi:MAG: hypothetical protein J5663_12255 [Bacteroidaceae bacterium]|nr:hypothetical protein [Bacteroidaceae bacterium]